MADARAEAEVVLFSCLDALFASTAPSIGPRDVDVLIVNCSLFVPTPSLSSLLVNRYRMRHDVQSYQLGGMGCSAGVIALHLARDLLQVYRSARCLVVSTEIITQSIHIGSDPSFLVSEHAPFVPTRGCSAAMVPHPVLPLCFLVPHRV